MGSYLVSFRPLEPYFFGNETSAGYGDKKNYYTVSENIPLQTTLLGALRFLLLPHMRTDYAYTEQEKDDNALAVGRASFDLHSIEPQSFGKIQRISPVFLLGTKDGEKKIYIRTPFDHYDRRVDKECPEKYQPFKKYQSVRMNGMDKLLPEQFSSKNYRQGSFMDMKTLRVYSEDQIFSTQERVGNQKLKVKDSFFKRAFKYMNQIDKHSLSFAVYAELDDVKEMQQIVYLGQNKSAFRCKIEKIETSVEEFYCNCSKLLAKTHQSIQEISDIRMYYALGDIYVTDEVSKHCQLALLNTRDFNYLRLNIVAKNHKKRHEKLFQAKSLICAGSFFLVQNQQAFEKIVDKKNCQMIGMNRLIGGK